MRRSKPQGVRNSNIARGSRYERSSVYSRSMKTISVRQICIPLWLATTLMLAPTPGRTQTLATRDSSGRDSPVKTKSYVDDSLPEIQKAVPQLHGLQPDPNQDQLPVLLTKAGKVAGELLRKTPSLLSHEQVEQASEMEDGKSSNSKILNGGRPRDFDYQILFHEDPVNNRIKLEEYRIDPQGRPIEPGVEDPRNPGSLGFANAWLLFLPPDQSQSKFRYLGRQQIDDQVTFVVAFAQNPGFVQVPAEVRFQGERIPVFWQGIAWIEESTFRIVRLRSDLLDPIPSIYLQQLTSQLQFENTNVSGVASPLWLPREVDITTKIKGQVVSEIHRYSNYRLYAVSSKIVPITP